ncbi:hypothetical protein FOZ63_019990, partial [Perkinsus olseni]
MTSPSGATQAAATLAAALQEQQEPPPADGLEPNHVQLIRNTALGVIRNGPQFAEWLQTKRRGDKQYTFLFKGLGHDYYQWCLSNPEECKRLEDAAQEQQADAESDSDASDSGSESDRSSRTDPAVAGAQAADKGIIRGLAEGGPLRRHLGEGATLNRAVIGEDRDLVGDRARPEAE